MEEMLEIFFVFICIAVSLGSAAKKAKQRRIYEAAKQSAPAKPESSKPDPAYTPAKPVVMPAMSFGDVPGQVFAPVIKPAPVAAPTVHPHVQPDCDTHDKPGSLGVTSMEGKDPCHEDELTRERAYTEPAPAEGGLTFNWTGNSMVNAVVMQEVLTRPCQRRAH